MWAIGVLLAVAGTWMWVNEASLLRLVCFLCRYFYCIFLFNIVSLKCLFFVIHQVCTRIGLAVCMLCMVLTLSTGSFLFGAWSHTWLVMWQGVRATSFLPSARNPLFMDFATLRAHPGTKPIPALSNVFCW